MTTGTRRDDHENVSFVRHVQAADTGISMLARWGNIGVSLITCGIMIGAFYTKFGALEASIERMQASVSSISAAQTNLDKQTDRNTNEIARLAKENADLRAQLSDARADGRQLLGWLNEIRSMREAYVYDSARSAQKQLQLQQRAATPP